MGIKCAYQVLIASFDDRGSVVIEALDGLLCHYPSVDQGSRTMHHFRMNDRHEWSFTILYFKVRTLCLCCHKPISTLSLRFQVHCVAFVTIVILHPRQSSCIVPARPPVDDCIALVK